jgi:predicted transcriptional regulator
MKSIIIRSVEKPSANQPQVLIKWFCEVFGLANDDEDNGIEEQILMRFAKAAYQGHGISSSELKLDKDIARSTVIYHLNRLMDMGIIIKRGRKYYLRAMDMSKTIEEIEYDLNREIMKMLDTAKEMDKLFEKSAHRRKASL